MAGIDWRKDTKDTMWAMFWMDPAPEAGDMEAIKASMKENVSRLIRMTTQKTAGQRKAASHIDWRCLDHVLLGIACDATALCLMGCFGEMPSTIDEQ